MRVRGRFYYFVTAKTFTSYQNYSFSKWTYQCDQSHVLHAAVFSEMRLASSHGAFNRLSRSLWPRTRLIARSVHAGLHPLTRKSFTELQADLDEKPLWQGPGADPNVKDVAVLGGGITGLATAFELSRKLPDAKITIYEAAKKLGGWMESEVVPVGDGEVIFEWGPRTLRHTPEGGATVHLVCLPSQVAMPTLMDAQMAHLGMAPDIVATSTRSAAATNRYIYHPDHLVRMPGPIPGASLFLNLYNNFSTIFTEPVFKGTFGGMIAEPAVDPRPPHMQDESVGDFITRRFGKPIADNLVSGFLHGIYAGDLYKLSARTLFPQLWHLETMDTGIVGSLFDNMWNRRSLVSYEQLSFLSQLSLETPPQQQLSDVLQVLQGASVYTFRRGLHQLVERLESALRDIPNVNIRTSTQAHSLRVDTSEGSKAVVLTVSDPGGVDASHRHDYLVSTVSHLALAKTFERKNNPGGAPGESGSYNRLRGSLLSNGPQYVNVMVVNLFYSQPDLLSVRGFGYLIPQSVPLEQNPERALGVIFGSETSSGLNNTGIGIDLGSVDTEEKRIALLKATRIGQDTARGTKLTVMLGGHWWHRWDPETDVPDETTAISMAKSVLERHLGIIEEPAVAKATLAKHAIPQYQVGYHRCMQTLHQDLLNEFGGKLKVAGTWCQGAVGVNDCIRKATEIAWSVSKGMDEATGLERFGKEDRWMVIEQGGKVLQESHKGKQE